MLKIAFVCIHNSCRSQIAEAICNKLANDTFECYSAGLDPSSRIDPIAARLVFERFSVDMIALQYPKTLSEIPPVDIVITMGCVDGCPVVSSHYHEDWGLKDPSGGLDDEYLAVMDRIEDHIIKLRSMVIDGQFDRIMEREKMV